MSDPIRLAIVAEGSTDRIVIEAIATALVPDRDFVVTQLQPLASDAIAPLGRGWTGVYQWCKQAIGQTGGTIHQDPLFDSHDLLLIHIDADVAGATYENGNINEVVLDLPCEQPCPPCIATTNALRNVLLRWIAAPEWPPRTIPCTPSKDTEAWVLAALYPDDDLVTGGNIECQRGAVARLAGKPAKGKMVRSKGDYYQKRTDRYGDRKLDITNAWNGARERCTEADRFSVEFTAAVERLDEHQ